MSEINKDAVHLLLKKLEMQGHFTKLEAESIVHALVDIKESIDKIYKTLIPIILSSNSTSNQAEFQESLWQIREEFRHIDYHIKDSNITMI
jgi:hypothetical protein